MDTYLKIAGDRTAMFSAGQDVASVAKEIAEVTHVLNTRVGALVGDAGWSGDAAESFREDWGKSSAAAGGVVQAMSKIATTLEKLAELLGEAQADLYNAQDYAARKGVKLDADGHPEPHVEASKHASAQEYLEQAKAAVRKAKRARMDAEREFASVVTQLAPGGGKTETLGTSDGLTLGDAARSLYGIPAARTALAREKVEKLESLRVQLKREHRHLPRQSEEWRAKGAERLAYRRLQRAAEMDLANIERSASKWKLSGATEITLGQLAEKAGVNNKLKFLGATPLIGGVFSGAGTALGMRDDMQRGWGFWHSAAVEGGSAAAGMAAGIGIEAIAPEAAPVAGVVVGGLAVGYAAGTYGVELGKAGHWQQNVHEHGVVSGIGHSFGDAGKTWWKDDVQGFGGKVVNSVKRAWGHVF